MNIFYFNITYTCNSSCIFCYSHNTIHSGRIHNEISFYDFIDYLIQNNISSNDRVIINGGEPFLHSEIINILYSLKTFNCEVLIYTNGRCLKNFDLDFTTEKYRFVIPVHGYEKLHDKITRSSGSFISMKEGLEHLSHFKCKVDIKVILNNQMISSDYEFEKTIQAIDTLSFDTSLHITKMADTIVSKRNRVPTVENDYASIYTKKLFDYFKNRGYVIKVFDTCVKDLDVRNYLDTELPIMVHFKDNKSEWDIELETPEMDCRHNCRKAVYCQSAVGNYTVLEYNGKFYKGLE